MSKRLLAILLFAFVGLSVSAQTDEAIDDSATQEAAKAARDAKRADRKAWNEENTIYKPIIGLGAGFFNYFGEVNNNQRLNPVVNNYGFQASVIKNFSPSFGLQFDVEYGRMSARQKSVDANKNLNFSTDVVNFNLQATYNFAGILRPGRFMNPFISVGVGAINFNTKGDLKDENGVAYNYWSDGTVRSLAQLADGSNDANAQILRPDYVYETDLRKANLDSLGNYLQFAATIPVTFGFHFRVSPRSSIRLASTFSYAFTDLIDNYTKDGVQGRVGDKMNDMFLYTNISYHFDFFTPKKVKTSRYDGMEFESLDGDDDNDGVPNIKDRCPNTPGGIVDEFGCSLDSDGDGVYDYADQEPNTDPGMNVDVNGVGITDDMLTVEDSLATIRAKMFEVYPDMREIYGGGSKKKTDTEILRARLVAETPFGIVDTDENGIISVNEVYEAIDRFFEGSLDVSAKYISDLIDYFFDQ